MRKIRFWRCLKIRTCFQVPYMSRPCDGHLNKSLSGCSHIRKPLQSVPCQVLDLCVSVGGQRAAEWPAQDSCWHNEASKQASVSCTERPTHSDPTVSFSLLPHCQRKAAGRKNRCRENRETPVNYEDDIETDMEPMWSLFVFYSFKVCPLRKWWKNIIWNQEQPQFELLLALSKTA